MSVYVTSDALAGVQKYLERAPDAVPLAASQALNRVIAGPGRRRIAEHMYRQVNFPSGYIDDKRLHVGQRATRDDLQASLVARQRATSLARFVPGGLRMGAKGFNVEVKPGSFRDMGNAFPIRLRQGATLDDDNYNMGLAIRLKPGERIFNRKSQPFNADASLVLLYGPSVDQVMLDVAAEEAPEILNDVDTEFFRNFARLTDSAL